MDFVACIKQIVKDCGVEEIAKQSFIGFLGDYHAFENESPSFKLILKHWSGNGKLEKISKLSANDSQWIIDASDIIHQTELEGFKKEMVSELLHKLLLGIGIVDSKFDWDKEFVFKETPTCSENGARIKPSQATTSSSHTKDIPLAWIGNGDDCSQRGTLYLDTKLPVTSKSIVLIKFNAAKWEGPIAGFFHDYRHTGEWLTINDKEYWEIKWSLRMHNNKLEFNFPIEQKKLVDLGIFLPHHDYIVQTTNCIPMVCKSEKTNFGDTIRGLKSLLKARGLQGITKDMTFDYTIKLFKIQNFAWQGLKIMFFKMIEDNITIADMRPVLHNGRPCMYDSVRKEYFYFSGNGNPSYQRD